MRFDLDKSTEKLQLTLDKKNVKTIKPCQVTFTMDVSGSFDDEHREGYTQKLLNRFVPFAMLFDKDKTLGSFAFGSNAIELEDINEKNYYNYIKRKVINCTYYGGGTYYGKAFEMLSDSCTVKKTTTVLKESKVGWLGKLFGQKKTVSVETETTEASDEKYLHFFVTDGSPLDGYEAIDQLERLAKLTPNMFIVFIGINDHGISFLNYNFTQTGYSSVIQFTTGQLRALENMSDEDLYDLVLNDSLIEWMDK